MLQLKTFASQNFCNSKLLQVNVLMWALDLPTTDRPTTLCIRQFDHPTVSGLIVPPTPAICPLVRPSNRSSLRPIVQPSD